LNVKRSRLSILAGILKLVGESGGMKMEGGFIEAVEGKGVVYRITKKGDKFVSEIKKIEKLSDAFGVPM